MVLRRTSKKKQRKKQAKIGGVGAAGIAAAAGGAFLVVSRRGRSLLFGKTKAAANAVTPSPTPDYDDVTLTRKVESEIFRPEGAPKGSVSVNTENGVVSLRGELSNVDEIEALEAATRKVDGVKDVNNLLHPPNTEAPTKTEGKFRSLAKR